MDMDETDDDDDDGISETREETLVLVGCRDGSVREFSLGVLGNATQNGSAAGAASKLVDVGPYSIAGPCFRPRRIIRVLKKDPIVHLTVPHLRPPQVRADGIVVYVAARRLERKDEEEKESSSSSLSSSKPVRPPKSSSTTDAFFSVEVIRVLLPHYDGSATDVRLPSTKESMRSLDKFKCRISTNKKKKFANTLPFRMVSAAKALPGSHGMHGGKENCSMFVVLARANAISVYYDQLHSSEVFPPMSISMPSNNPLTVASISLNKADITCGHYRGNIRVMNNILNDIELFHIATKKAKQLNGEPLSLSKSSKSKGAAAAATTTASASMLPPDPRKNMITSRVHWHALPVTSIVYDSMSYPMDPLLYSGGDESVLVTWQISQGRDRPVHVHPRLALGGIVHLSSCDRCDDRPTSGILVYCEDNTLQLLESHNKGCLWKVEGLACAQKQKQKQNTEGSLRVDPRSTGQKNSQLVITGLKQAPGFIHWFDPMRGRLASSLEVVPFNRISKTELDERSLPKPSITGHAFSKNGNDLITIDESQTENIYVGALDKAARGDEYGTVSTIRFWSWNDSSSTKGDASPPYHEVASMTYPHGPKNRVSAVGMSKDGTVACTVSCSEKAFRVWRNSKGTEKSASWACRYKVKVPAGFSNCSTKTNGMTFSDDNSLLVIAFGQTGTIWDADGARLLTTFDHSQGNADIDSVEFITPGFHQDLLLIRSKACVSLRSPYGPYGSSTSFRGWSWSVPQNQRGDAITAVEYVESRGCIAIAIHSAVENQSRVIFIDVNTGKGGAGGRESSPLSLVENVSGCISSLCAVGKQQLEKSNWENASRKKNKSALTLYALTSVGDLILLTEDRSNIHSNAAPIESFVPTGPRLEIATHETSRRKRQRTNIRSGPASLSEELLKPTKLALDIFGFGTNNDLTLIPSTAELPSLSANFVKTFVCRNLRKTKS
mmetsp:Transcript_1992/g.5294  ORF Transcript_1992/g.5294 Transcript_1992/m.5294 type:complete len:951 (+) Transcript_1992:689-3541(+)